MLAILSRPQFAKWCLVTGSYMAYECRADSRFVPSQWETSLQSNTISHWLGANLESAMRVGWVSVLNASELWNSTD